LADSQFSVITDINVPDHKTKNFQAIIDKTKLEGKILIAVDKKEEKTVLASRNIPGVTLSLFSDVNAFQVLKHRQFLITEKGLELLTKKLKG
jgi:ribosomal protein L4